MTTLTTSLTSKTFKPDSFATKIITTPSLLPDLITALDTPTATIRYRASKTLITLSQHHPQLLYPSFDTFVHLLESQHRILTWNALTILANLTKVDTQHKFETIFDTYYHHLTDGYLVTITTIIQASPTIQQAKPHLTTNIITKLLSTHTLPTGPHLTTECKRIIAAKTIQALDTIYPHTTNHQPILDYVTHHTTSTRPSTRKAAQTFLKKHGENKP